MTESYSEILYGPNRSYDAHFKGSFIFIRPIRAVYVYKEDAKSV